MLRVESDQMDVIAVHHTPAPLLDAEVIVALVERGEMCSARDAKLETHLWIAHGGRRSVRRSGQQRARGVPLGRTRPVPRPARS
jgi:hypothetical protein